MKFKVSSVIERMKCSSTPDFVDTSLNNGASGGSIGNDQPSEKGSTSFHAHCSVQTCLLHEYTVSRFLEIA